MQRVDSCQSAWCTDWSDHHHRVFLLTCRYRGNSHISGPHSSWLAAHMAGLTPGLQVSLSWGSIAESFHSLQSLSVSCLQVILFLPGPCLPSTCMSKAVLSRYGHVECSNGAVKLTAPLEHSTYPYQQSLMSPAYYTCHKVIEKTFRRDLLLTRLFPFHFGPLLKERICSSRGANSRNLF